MTRCVMIYNCDSYLEVGTAHLVCEDYAVHGIYKGIPFIIVSDGCSASADTDVGARIMTHAFKKALVSMIDRYLRDGMNGYPMAVVQEHILALTLHNCKTTADSLGLAYSACDATLLAVFIHKNRCWMLRSGDGAIALKYKTNPGFNAGHFQGIEAYQYEYVHNAPFYLSYRLDPLRMLRYQEQYGKRYVMVKQHWLENGPGHWREEILDQKPDDPQWLVKDARDLEFVSIASDGLGSFARRCDGEHPLTNVPLFGSHGFGDMVYWFTAYKNSHGRFVQRRMKRLKIQLAKYGIVHYDDISTATIRIKQ